MDFNRIVQELVPQYLAARRQEVPEMMRLLEAGDHERLRVLSHSLKGSGSSFGFPELSRFGALLERHAEQSDLTAFRVELDRLSDYLERVKPSAGSSTAG